MQIYRPNLKNDALCIFEPGNPSGSNYRDPGIGSIVGAKNIGCVAQVGRSADQIDCSDPNFPDLRAVYTYPIFLTLIKKVAAAAAGLRLQKCNVDAAFLSMDLY